MILLLYSGAPGVTVRIMMEIRLILEVPDITEIPKNIGEAINLLVGIDSDETIGIVYIETDE